MKTLELLAFLKEPKIREEITKRFGAYESLLANLIRKGAVVKINDYAKSSCYNRGVAAWVATGKVYDTKAQHISKRREYNKVYGRARYLKKKAEKKHLI
jgi:hypothetical protein